MELILNLDTGLSEYQFYAFIVKSGVSWFKLLLILKDNDQAAPLYYEPFNQSSIKIWA